MPYIAEAKSPNGLWVKVDVMVLGVSVGKDDFEGEKLAAMVGFAGGTKKNVIILVADELQRWNIMATTNMKAIEARQVARARGDAWLSRNAPIIEGFKIVRWKDYTSSRGFCINYRRLHRLFNAEPLLAAALDKDTTSVIKRVGLAEPKNGNGVHISRRKIRFLQNFILEELAADITAAETEPRSVAYPGDELFTYKKMRFLNGNTPFGPAIRRFPRCHLRLRHVP